MRAYPVSDPVLKVLLHRFALLSELPKVKISLFDKDLSVETPLYLETSSEALTIRWPQGSAPFEKAGNVELSTNIEYTGKVRQQFDLAIDELSNKRWDISSFEEFLQGTKVVHLGSGDQKDWNEIIGEFLPSNIINVEIYDRYLRN